ncbi:MAG: hypothetical protein WCO38_06780 [Verrucomicrobiota bacterium]
MKSNRNFLIVVLALFFVGSSVLALRQYQELVALRAKISGDNSADLQKRLARAMDELKSLRDKTASAQKVRKADGTDNETADPGSAADNANRRNRGFDAFREAMNNPQFQKLMAIQAKAQLDSRYAPLFKELAASGLSPVQIDQFKNMLVQKQQAVADAYQAAREQGINPRQDPAAFKQIVTDAQAAVDQQIQSQLGPTAFAQFQNYQQTIPDRNVTNSLQQSLSYSSAPLSDDQANALIQILAQNGPQKNGNTNAGGGGGGGGGGAPGGIGGIIGMQNQMAPITNQAIQAAQGVLSQPQIDALTQLQQTQKAQAQMQKLMQAAQASRKKG